MMKILFRFMTVLVCFAAHGAFACSTAASVCKTPSEGAFALIEKGRPVSVVVETTSDPAVLRVAQSFARDLKRVSGKKAKVIKNGKAPNKPVVLIGELGKSTLIDALVSSGKLKLNKVAGQWEAFQVSVVKNPWPKVDSAVVIVGADRRGAIYGTYDLSERMGVSPWYWFADASVQQRKDLYITAGSRSDHPKVRYRGIFINDEDPALSGWARHLFGGVNADMYEQVFELILRMKGNYIWPAMWGKAFHLDDPRNTALADAMGIVVGSSHHEPMNRAQQEWHSYPDDTSIGGAWNYETNTENLRKFWRGGIERMMSKGGGQAYESLVTLGMRGDGDEPMSEGTAIELLETIVADQRNIIAEITKKPAAETPQMWALYKEVQDYYDKGMTVPDDVTLLFADDNWGQIRRLPTKDLHRKGGYGVYYHFDYVGGPRNYKWTNTIQIGKVWQQMNLAYERGARDIWVVNVGDIKPIEMPIEFFLDMAWNPEAMTTEALNSFPAHWAGQIFGQALAEDIGEMLTLYGNYASIRKPELLNEKTFAIGNGTGKALSRSEFLEYVENWQALIGEMEIVKDKITPQQYSSFFQLVEYPIASLGNLYQLYFATAWNHKLANQHDSRANHFLKQVEEAYTKDSELVEKYHSINGGKWNGMMNQVHMNYVIWNTPTQQSMPPVMAVHGGSNKIDVVFENQKNLDPTTIHLEASAYTRAVDGAGLSWKAVPNLGQSKAAMLSLPQGTAPTTTEDGVRLEYQFNNQTTGDIEVALQVSPTLDTLNRGGIRIGVSIDKGPVKTLKLHLIPTGGAARLPEQKAWVKAVINNRHEVATTFAKLSKGKHTLKIWRLDDNVILEDIIISY